MNRFKDLPPTPETGGDFIPPDWFLPVSPQLPTPRSDSSTLPPHSSDGTPTATSDARRWVAHESDSKEDDEKSAEHLPLVSKYPPRQEPVVQPPHAHPRPLPRPPTVDASTISFARTSTGWLDLSTSTSPLPPPVPPKDPKVSRQDKKLPLPLRLPSSKFGSIPIHVAKKPSLQA